VPQSYYRDAIRFTVIMERGTHKLIKNYAESQGMTASRFASLCLENLSSKLNLKENDIEPLNSPGNREKRREERQQHGTGDAGE
jgi:hypothetical protein